MKSALQMKSTIVDEMKPVLYSDEVGFHHEVISSIIDGFIPSWGTDFDEKKTSLS
ncbi:MAG: hypothetical protein IJB27_05270 [Clostridia bacterium]|nr:hypothetical protein [Clostridia bacterium]